MKAIWAWIVQAAKDIYSFVYTEVGKILALLKDPSGKFSHKRILALGFGLLAVYLVVDPRGWLDFVVAAGFGIGAVILAWVTVANKG